MLVDLVITRNALVVVHTWIVSLLVATWLLPGYGNSDFDYVHVI